MTASLRTAALQGGALVAARQAVSLVVGLGGTVVLTGLLGPSGYGRFAAALALYTYAFTVAPLGVNGWLVRRSKAADGASATERTGATSSAPLDGSERDAEVVASARSLLLLSSLVIGGIAALLIPAVARWLRAPDLAPLAFAMLAGLPVQLLNLVPLAVLERALNYRAVAAAELQGLVLYYGIAVFLAWRGMGPEAIVIGWWVQIAWIALRVHRAAGLPLRFGWRPAVIRESLDYGLRYASSLWTYQLRDLVNPLIVGRWQGVEGVAIVALAVRLVEAASFVKVATWRLSLPALARLQHDTARLAIAVRDGMRLQLMLVGPALLALAVVGVPVAMWLFGPQWAGLGSVMALIAAGTLCNATFNLHSSALYALGRPADVWVFHVVHVGLFAGAAALLVPRLGVSGYGFAELVAFPSYLVIWRAYRRAVEGGGEVGALAQSNSRVSSVSPTPIPSASSFSPSSQSSSPPLSVSPEAVAQGTVSQAPELQLAAALVLAVALSWWTPWAAPIAVLPLLRRETRALLAESVATLRGVIAARAA